jgi:hypothetical protein
MFQHPDAGFEKLAVITVIGVMDRGGGQDLPLEQLDHHFVFMFLG